MKELLLQVNKNLRCAQETAYQTIVSIVKMNGGRFEFVKEKPWLYEDVQEPHDILAIEVHYDELCVYTDELPKGLGICCAHILTMSDVLNKLSMYYL